MDSRLKTQSFSETDQPCPAPQPNYPRPRANATKVMGWLRCRLDMGMFIDEVAVTYPAPGKGEWQTSVYVPSSFVRSESEHEGEVMVEVVFQHGKRCAVLPNNEQHIVRAEDGDLRLS